MSVTATASSVSYDCNGGAQDFPVIFKFLEDDDLTVKITTDDGATFTTLTEGVEYTIENDGDEGGTVSTVGTYDPGTTIVITRNTDITQETSFTPQGSFPAQRHETAYDKLTMVCQDLARRLAAVEALNGTVTSGDVGDAAVATGTLSVGDVLEDEFPFNVAVTDASEVGWVLMQIAKSDGSEVFDEPPVMQWGAGDASHISVKRISGLSPNTDYDYTLLCIYTP